VQSSFPSENNPVISLPKNDNTTSSNAILSSKQEVSLQHPK